MNKPQLASVIFLMTVISVMPELFAQDTIRSSVYFGYNKQEISPAEQTRLDSLLNSLGDCPVRYIRITGNTDASGSTEYNQRLSAERAREVYDYLASKGMKADQLEILSQGKSLPLYSGDDENAMAGNRRCDIEFTLWEDNTTIPFAALTGNEKFLSRDKGELKLSGEILLRSKMDDNGNIPEIRLNVRPNLISDVQKLLKNNYLTMSPSGSILIPAAIVEWNKTGSAPSATISEEHIRFDEPLEMVLPVKVCNCKPKDVSLWKPVKLDTVLIGWEKVNDSVQLTKKNRVQQYVVPVRTTETFALMCEPVTKKKVFVFKGLHDASLKVVFTRAKVIVTGNEIEPGVIEILLPDIKEIPRVYAKGISDDNELFTLNGKRLSECRHNLITGEYTLRRSDFRKKTPQRLKKVDRDDVIFSFVPF